MKKNNNFECVIYGIVSVIILFAVYVLVGLFVSFTCKVFDFPAMFIAAIFGCWYLLISFNKDIAKLLKNESRKLKKELKTIIKKRHFSMNDFILFTIVTAIIVLFVVLTLSIFASLFINSDSPIGYIFILCSIALILFRKIYDMYKRERYYR